VLSLKDTLSFVMLESPDLDGSGDFF